MSAKKAKHPGVVLIAPTGDRKRWRARWKDPEAGKHVFESLDPALRTKEQRTRWAVRKSEQLAVQRLKLLEQPPNARKSVAISDAVDRYFEDHKARLRPSTQELYQWTADRFLAWAKAAGLRTTGDLGKPQLLAFRAVLVSQPRQVPVAGPSGSRAADATPRAPATVNRELRALGTVLEYLRGLELLPAVDRDGIRDGLKKLQQPPNAPTPLTPPELRTLLQACREHDSAVYKQTRTGQTDVPRYPEIGPFLLTVLLTGARFSEILSLTWVQVDLEAKDMAGNPAPEILLSPDNTKTKRGRRIDLAVSPALVELFENLPKSDGRVLPLSKGEARAAERRLRRDFKAPEFNWQTLRQTCAVFLTNAPGIFGGASAYRSARQLGHSVEVADKHYLEVARGIPADAKSLDTAMQIEAECSKLVTGVRQRLTLAQAASS